MDCITSTYVTDIPTLVFVHQVLVAEPTVVKVPEVRKVVIPPPAQVLPPPVLPLFSVFNVSAATIAVMIIVIVLYLVAVVNSLQLAVDRLVLLIDK
jgi:hypothetical protein